MSTFVKPFYVTSISYTPMISHIDVGANSMRMSTAFVMTVALRYFHTNFRLEEASCPVGTSCGIRASIDNPVGKEVTLASRVRGTVFSYDTPK